MGNCYYNRSSDISKSMNDIADDNEYAKTAAVYQQLLRDALPYLEKAESINGMDHNTLVMLKQVYTRIEVNEGEPDFKEKLKAVEAKLKELESQKAK